MKVRIYYHHTDCGGVVYYGEYLKFLEEGRTEFFEQKGIFVKDLMRKGILFVVARQEIDYKLPAVYGDILEIETRVNEISRSKIEFEHNIKNQDGKLVSTAKTALVFVDKDVKPRKIPEDIREKLSKS
ncbi:MAG: acyl-CoA thioesterase [Candidatus Omnitrophica bacterium]|nr:acyl-CoA thioesterase [Candidatus Omnitrophota bacterium]